MNAQFPAISLQQLTLTPQNVKTFVVPFEDGIGGRMCQIPASPHLQLDLQLAQMCKFILFKISGWD